MSLRLGRSCLALAGLLLLAGLAGHPALAQESGQVWLAPIETAEFPQLTSYMEARDSAGSFVVNLDQEQVRIIEDGVVLPVTELNLLRQGVQFVTAFATGRSFAIRDAQGMARHDYIRKALNEWALARVRDNTDDLSFLTPDGPELTHTDDARRWADAAQSYQPVESGLPPDFDILGRALEIAADSTPRPGMARAVLFIAPPPEQDVSLGLQSMAARAKDRGVRIFVWMVASTELFNSPGAAQLNDLAAQTGGTLFPFSGTESLPDLEAYFEPLRSIYFLAYQSEIKSEGLHETSVQVSAPGLQASSEPQEFELDVLAPSVAFVSPPAQVERSFPSAEEKDPEQLVPKKVDLEALIEFPDGHVRPLVSTALLVDGAEVDVNTTPPFDRFSWDLTEITSSARHSLKVEARDSLGLIGSSVETEVTVLLDNPERTPLAVVSANRGLVVAVVVVIAGAVLGLVLVLGGRLRPGMVRERQRKKRLDPVTQPVKLDSEAVSPRRTEWRSRLHLPERRVPPKIYAFLVHISEAGPEENSLPIAISREEVTFGSDPFQANQVLDDPSVDGLHARLKLDAQGSFYIFDEGSTAGTWVNYTPVPSEGVRMQHGDVLHIGRLGFHFRLREPQLVRRPQVTPAEPLS